MQLRTIAIMRLHQLREEMKFLRDHFQRPPVGDSYPSPGQTAKLTLYMPLARAQEGPHCKSQHRLSETCAYTAQATSRKMFLLERPGRERSHCSTISPTGGWKLRNGPLQDEELNTHPCIPLRRHSATTLKKTSVN